MTTRRDTPRRRPRPEQLHDGFRYFGPRQGMQCRCGAWLSPVSGAMVDQVAEWRFHVWQSTGAWPQQEYPQGAS